MSVWCATLLNGLEWTGLVGSNLRGRACGPNGTGTGEEGVLSDVVPELFILPGFRVSVSLGV